MMGPYAIFMLILFDNEPLIILWEAYLLPYVKPQSLSIIHYICIFVGSPPPSIVAVPAR